MTSCGYNDQLEVFNVQPSEVLILTVKLYRSNIQRNNPITDVIIL